MLRSPVKLPRAKDLPRDLLAALTLGVVQIPDAMATAVLGGVKPVNGLNSHIVGTPVGGLLSGSEFMAVVTTSAMGLAVGSALTAVRPADRIPALFVLTFLIGVFQIAMGLLRTGGLTRFISNSVMVGFLSGVGVLIILGQLPDITGYDSAYSNKVVRGFDILVHPGGIDLPTLGVGIATIAAIVLLGRTRLSRYSMVIALVAVTGVVAVWNPSSVALVKSVADIPNALPGFNLPKFGLIPQLILPAIAVALIGMVQAAGVSKSLPNADGAYGDPSRDFIAQGGANLAAGLFRGMPIGGSVSASRLNVESGARSRWALVFVGPVIGLALVLFGGAISQVPLPAIGGILIVAGYGAIDRHAVREVWQTRLASRLIMAGTFVLVLAMPIQYAVLVAVAVTFVQHVYSDSLDVKVCQVIRREDGRFEEHPGPAVPADDAVTLLDVYGNVFWAATDAVKRQLPDPAGAHRAVIVVRLRGRGHIGSAFVGLVKSYAEALREGGGELILAGIGPSMVVQLERTGIVDLLGREHIFVATPVVYESTEAAVRVGEAFLET